MVEDDTPLEVHQESTSVCAPFCDSYGRMNALRTFIDAQQNGRIRTEGDRSDILAVLERKCIRLVASGMSVCSLKGNKLLT